MLFLSALVSVSALIGVVVPRTSSNAYNVAVQIGWEEVNSSSCPTTIQPLFREASSLTVGLAILDLLSQGVSALLVPDSESASIAADISPVPVISYDDGEAVNTPLSYRVTYSSEIFAVDTTTLIRYFNWTKVILLCSSKMHATGACQHFIDIGRASKVYVASTETIESDGSNIETTIVQVKRSRVRVVVLWVEPELVLPVLLKAHELSMDAGYQWIGNSAILTSNVVDALMARELEPSTYRIFSSFLSFLIISQPEPDATKESLFKDLWTSGTNSSLELYSRRFVDVHDAFVVTANALNRVCNLSSPDFQTAIATWSPQTLRTNFLPGNPEPTGLGPLLIQNLQPAGFSVVGYVTPGNLVLTSNVLFPYPNISSVPNNFIQSPCPPSTLVVDCNKTMYRSNTSIVVITHAPPDQSSSFWTRFASGLQVAAFAMRVNFTYLYDSDIDGMIALIRQVTAKPPDGVILSLPNAARLKQPLIDLLLTGIDVVTVNTGANLSSSLKPLHSNLLLHVGQNETAAGVKAGQAFLDRNVLFVVFVVPTLPNDAFTERLQGLESALLPAGGTVISANVRNTSALNVLTGKSNKGILTANGDVASANAATWFAQFPGVVIGCFDAPDGVLAAMDYNYISFLVYQQPWLQGFLPLNIITLAIAQRNWEAMDLVETGGTIITSASQVRNGENPTDFTAQTYAVVTTGVPSDSFWRGLRLGMDQAAIDFRATINYDYYYSNAAGAYRNALGKLLALTGPKKIKGLIIDFGDADLVKNDLILQAFANNVPVVGVFHGGYDAAKWRNNSLMLGYVGVDDTYAGNEAARRLIEQYGATNLMMINFSPSMPERFQALAKTFSSYGFPWSYWVSDSTATDFANYQSLESALRADASIDAIFSSGNFHIPWYQQAATVLDRSIAMAAGTLGVYTQEVYSSRMKFGINQQEYIMGYIPVRMLSLYYAIGLSKLPQFFIETGPAFVTIREVVSVECSNLLKRCPTAKICAPGNQFITPICAPCAAGSYESNGDCTLCPAGTYQPLSAASSPTQCQPCLPGSTSTVGSSSCSTCPNCSLAFTLPQPVYRPFNPLPPPVTTSFSSRAFFASLIDDPTLVWLFRVLVGLVVFLLVSTLCTFLCCRRRLNRLKMFDQTFKDPIAVRNAVGEKTYNWPDFLEPPKFPIGGVFSLFVGTIAFLLVIAYIVYMTRRVKEDTAFLPLLKLRPEVAWLTVEVRIAGNVPCDISSVNTSATTGLISSIAPRAVTPYPSECSIFWEFRPLRSLDRAQLVITFSNSFHQYANAIAYRLQTVSARTQTAVEKIGQILPGPNNVFCGPTSSELSFSMYHTEFDYLQEAPRYGIIVQELAPLLGSTRSKSTFYSDAQSLAVKVNLVWADLYELTTVSSLSDPFTLLTQIGGLAFYWQLFMVLAGSLLMKYVSAKVTVFKKFGGGNGEESNRASIRYLTHFGLELADVRKEKSKI